MDRREFLAAMATVPALATLQPRPVPDYRIVTNHKPAPSPACPVPIPGAWSRSTPRKVIDEVTEKVDVPTVQAMIARGMSTLTGDKDPRDSWARFFNAQDFVGIKVNASGAPGAMSMPEVVAEITRNLIDRRREADEHRDSRARRRPDPAPEVRPVRARRRSRRVGEHLARLRSRRLRRGELLRRGGHALVPDSHGHGAVHEDHQRAEHEGPRRLRRDRVPEEHRLRRVQQRGPLALPRADRDADLHRHAGDASSRCARERCSTSWTVCAASGTPARSRETGSTASIRSR